jgi:hypothetical protein
VIERFKYEKLAKGFEPAAKPATKDSWVWKVIAVILHGVSFGGLPYRRFLTEVATTFGPIQAYPRELPSLSTRLLVHECRHTTQAVWLGWLFPVLGWFFGRRVRAYAGLPFMAILYLLFPLLPVALNVCRWLFELDADRASWRWMLDNGYSPDMVKLQAEEFAKDVCGGPYVFAWLSFLGGVAAFTRSAAKVVATHEQK